jgi:hypothetical protein
LHRSEEREERKEIARAREGEIIKNVERELDNKRERERWSEIAREGRKEERERWEREKLRKREIGKDK